MNAVSMGSLMASISNRAAAENSVRLLRRTYNVSDPRANVARRLGDESVRQGKIVTSTISETATKWFKHTNEAARHAYAGQMRAFEQGKASGAESRSARQSSSGTSLAPWSPC